MKSEFFGSLDLVSLRVLRPNNGASMNTHAAGCGRVPAARKVAFGKSTF
jgi:hypothetical protein